MILPGSHMVATPTGDCRLSTFDGRGLPHRRSSVGAIGLGPR